MTNSYDCRFPSPAADDAERPKTLAENDPETGNRSCRIILHALKHHQPLPKARNVFLQC
jgi:hypothetical protein